MAPEGVDERVDCESGVRAQDAVLTRHVLLPQTAKLIAAQDELVQTRNMKHRVRERENSLAVPLASRSAYVRGRARA